MEILGFGSVLGFGGGSQNEIWGEGRSQNEIWGEGGSQNEIWGELVRFGGKMAAL